MSWRPLGPTNRYASRRRILASLGPKSARPPQGTFSIMPAAPVPDAFAKLAQQNLNRLRGLNEEALAKQKLASVQASEELKHAKSQKDVNTATERGSGDNVKSEHEKSHHVSSITGSTNVGAKEEDAATVDRKKAREREEAIHKDLDYVLDAFRTLQEKAPQSDQSPMDAPSFLEPAPGLRTSPLGRLANQYYQNKAKLSSDNTSRTYSTRSDAARNQLPASSSASDLVHP